MRLCTRIVLVAVGVWWGSRGGCALVLICICVCRTAFIIILYVCGQMHVYMYACLAVTCHLHFWQNDRDL